MKARQLKDKFINFFVSQQHVEIPSAGVVPENDPTTLFISAGMHPLVPFLLGQPHPLGKRLTDVQKCVRTGDIDDVGDGYHHTFFEMLGNWSLGDYFKENMIPWSYQFLTEILNIDPKILHVTCFEGDTDAPKDTQSHDLWLKQGIPKDRIHYLPKKDNWWGPAGSVGPCGPDTEMFIDTKPDEGEIDFVVGCKQGRIIEIWNDVFMQYYKDAEGKFSEMSQKNVDTGMGVERTTAILSGFSDNYMSDIWQPIIKKIEEISGKKYSDQNFIKSIRIVADHIRSAVFIIADGVEPSNKEAGYVLRRLIRRSIRQGKILGIETNFTSQVADAVLDNQDNYGGIYPELNDNRDKIISLLDAEENKFRKTLNRGLMEIQKDELNFSKLNKDQIIDAKYLGERAFYYYESFGFPIEMFLEEMTLVKTQNKDDIIKSFEKSKEDHQKLSQTLSAGKFKSGLADNSEIITKYHTATHLLHQSLRKILGEHVQQSGSNITSERLRFDFSHNDKLTEDQLKQVANLVNQQIQLNLPVTKETIPFIEAQRQGAIAFFGSKYPEVVSVYTVGSQENYFSKEVCTGPHVNNTSELGTFEIIKEESAGSGKRRIYAILK